MQIGTGRHSVKVVSTMLAVNKNNSDAIVVVFENEEGARISAFLHTSEKAWPYSEEKLRTLGWDPASRDYRFEELDEDPSPIAGNEVEIVVDSREWNGKTQQEVKFINPPRQRMTEEDRAGFGSRLRKALGVKSTGAPAKRRAAPSVPWED